MLFHSNRMTLKQALTQAQALGVDRLDAQLLLLHALGKPSSQRAWLLAHDTDVVPEQAQQHFQQLAQRRAAGEPLAYLVGSKEFFGLTLQVDARVLVPRPDTETLVHWALQVMDESLLPVPRVLDLGTGSGAIALAVKHQRSQAHVGAVDVSSSALQVAASNAQRLGLAVQFIASDWLAQVPQRWNVIASNPPYIAQTDPHLADLAHEPSTALVAGPDGLDAIRHIIVQAPSRLYSGAWLLLEHGYDQAAQVQALLAARGFTQVQGRQDLAGIPRCSGGRWVFDNSAPN